MLNINETNNITVMAIYQSWYLYHSSNLGTSTH